MAENANAALTAPAGTVFVNVGFASYGTPTGTCPTFTVGSCHATTSQSVCEGYLIGNNTATIPATNAVFTDPCVGTLKNLYVNATYNCTQFEICEGNSPGTILGMVPIGGNGTYTYLWESSTTSAVAGFGTATGTNNTQNYTPGTLSQTTWFRRTVSSGACSNISTAIEITVKLTPVITNPGAQTSCDNYNLPPITGTNLSGNQNYYNNSQALSGTVITGPITTTQTIWIYDANGTCSDEESFLVTVNPLPTATISSNNSPVCAGDDALFILTGTSGATVTYNINSGTNTNVTLTGGTATVTVSGATTNQTLTLISVINGTCSQSLSGSSTVTVNPLPATGEIIPD